MPCIQLKTVYNNGAETDWSIHDIATYGTKAISNLLWMWTGNGFAPSAINRITLTRAHDTIIFERVE